MDTTFTGELLEQQGSMSGGRSRTLSREAHSEAEHVLISHNYDNLSFLSDEALPSERARNNIERQQLRERGRYSNSHRERQSTEYSYTTFAHRGTEDGRPLLKDSRSTSSDNTYGTVADKAAVKEGDDVPLVTIYGAHTKKEKMKRISSMLRVVAMTALIVLAVILFSINPELDEEFILGTTSKSQPFQYVINTTGEGDWHDVTLRIRGAFIDLEYLPPPRNNTSVDSFEPFFDPDQNLYNCTNFLVICGYNSTFSDNTNSTACDVLHATSNPSCTTLALVPDKHKLLLGEHSKEKTISRTLRVNGLTEDNLFHLNFLVDLQDLYVPFEFAAFGEILGKTGQIVVATLILVMVYVLIVFDLVHRTVAAMIGSTVVLAVLSMLKKRPSLEAVVEWISLETVSLLFGMMVLVAIFSQTGFFDYIAVKAYRLARGKVWPLISLLCFFSAFVSAFLDNVTTILLLTPVSIRLCQVLNLDPKPILIAEVVFSNIGGTATAIGDPPNIIIVSHPLIKEEGIKFAEFTLHLFIGIVFCMLIAYGLLAIYYYTLYVGRKDSDPPHVAELKREIAIWERTARLMPVVSLEERGVREALMKKAMEVRLQLKEAKTLTQRSACDLWKKNLRELEGRYRITDRLLLVKSFVVLLVVIIFFFFSNLLPKIELELGWIAILGAIVLLILADIQEMEGVLHKVEWGTLLFFAALFVLMEGLAELGLIDFIGEVMVSIINKVDLEYQLLVAIVIVVWVSALVSSFIDNIPFTSATIPVIAKLAASPEVCLSLRPLVWALAFGACLGGNGTIIGASANVVCAGLAEQNGYKITFMDFFKIGFPMMLFTTLTACVYLVICHGAIQWDWPDCLDR